MGDEISDEDYIETIIASRAEAEDYMENDPESPFHKKGDVEFTGLKYFKVNPKYKVKASIERLTSPEPLDIELTNGEIAKYFKYAIATFDLDGMPQKLQLLKPEKYWDEDWLFLPFYDLTSANESYGGGRFLNLEYTDQDILEIDFNLAYNPYCAYTDTYRCPIPPADNNITVEVRAGERIYDDHH
jgi:uncharacterized protein (DUF1684 family)